MKERIDISIIIVSYNTRKLTKTCISSVIRTLWGTRTHEIIVVDNGSTDGTVRDVKKDFPGVRVIENKRNVGFAAANNQGIQASRGRYILLLNSDTEVYPETLQKMLAFMDCHEHAGASTCKLVLPGGTMDPACHRGFPTPWNALTYYAGLEKLFPKIKLFGGYHQGYKDLSVPHEIDAVSGAFFMVRKSVIDQVGILDEAYFMYAEDIDWAYRIKAAGWHIWFYPDTKALHHKKQSGRSHVRKEMRLRAQEYFLLNNKYFYTKHYKNKYSPIITFFVSAFYDVQLWTLQKIGWSLSL